MQEIQSGTAPNPVAQLVDLSAILQGVEIWLLTHPAPEVQLGEYVESIVKVFVALGELYEVSATMSPRPTMAPST